MTITMDALFRRPGRLFIDGEWVSPAGGTSISVVDSTTEEVFLQVGEANAADMDRAVGAARRAFDDGPWPRLTHAERAAYLRAFADGWRQQVKNVEQLWPREAGMVARAALASTERGIKEWEDTADLAESFPFTEVMTPGNGGAFGLVRREPVGVVAAIIPWNAPMPSLTHKIAPALLAGCTVILKTAPEAPGEGFLAAQIAEDIGLPPGVLNVVVADREVSELLVRDPRVDKVSFTGSTAAGKRIASLCGERVARYSLELGGKSVAVILDDADIERTAATIAAAECALTGQVCYSLTRLVVLERQHDAFAEALASAFAGVKVGDPYADDTQMGPLASEQQRSRVEGYISAGVAQGARLVSGGRRPQDLDRGFFVEPTVFARVDNAHTIAREEIFGPVLSVIPAADEAAAIRIANDTVYGLNASVFTADPERALRVAAQLRSGTVGHNATRSDLTLGFGGFKQSGVGREGGVEGLRQFLESKAVVLDEIPRSYA
jgi:acyl-CoA reductase-like NAD-dependent aldehyde dehydrogenase